MVDSNYLVVQDCKNKVLNDEIWSASLDYGLFHLTPQRKIIDKSIFDDCAFFDLFIDDKTDWGAPIPSTFQAFFPDLIKLLVPKDEALFLNVVDLYEGYFDQDKFISEFLKPHHYDYFFLNKEINDQILSSLFFEFPVNQVHILNEIAFAGMEIDVDGFVLTKQLVDAFKRLANQNNTDEMFRELIRNVYMAFGIWADHNGMFIVTDKFDIPFIQKHFGMSPLEREIESYIHKDS